MKERLEQFMGTMGLTAGQLAAKMGVQRSGISHLLAGRNKPSYDFMLKFLKTFPSVRAEWLLTGQGSMLRDEDQPELFSGTAEAPVSGQGQPAAPPSEVQPEPGIPRPEQITATHSGKEIRQVMLFYDDGTVEIFKPGK